MYLKYFEVNGLSPVKAVPKLIYLWKPSNSPAILKARLSLEFIIARSF